TEQNVLELDGAAAAACRRFLCDLEDAPGARVESLLHDSAGRYKCLSLQELSCLARMRCFLRSKVARGEVVLPDRRHPSARDGRARVGSPARHYGVGFRSPE